MCHSFSSQVLSGVGRSLKVGGGGGGGGGGAMFDGYHGRRAVPLPQPARGVL